MKVDDIIKIIRRNPMIESVEYVTGGIDLVLKMHVRSIEELNEYVVDTLSNYKGIEKTNTLFVLVKRL